MRKVNLGVYDTYFPHFSEYFHALVGGEVIAKSQRERLKRVQKEQDKKSNEQDKKMNAALEMQRKATELLEAAAEDMKEARLLEMCAPALPPALPCPPRLKRKGAPAGRPVRDAQHGSAAVHTLRACCARRRRLMPSRCRRCARG